MLFSQTSDVMRVLPVDSESNRCIICVFCFVRQPQDFVLSFFPRVMKSLMKNKMYNAA